MSPLNWDVRAAAEAQVAHPSAPQAEAAAERRSQSPGKKGKGKKGKKEGKKGKQKGKKGKGAGAHIRKITLSTRKGAQKGGGKAQQK